MTQSQLKTSFMRYELLYVIPATYAETELPKVMEGVTKELAKLEAEIVRNESVGKLKLAYPVKKFRHGHFVLVDMHLAEDKLRALDTALRLHPDVIRHQLVVKDEAAKPVTRLSSVDRIERDRAPRRSKAEQDAHERQSAAAPKKGAEKVAVDMKEIDKKLDRIVEGKILE